MNHHAPRTAPPTTDDVRTLRIVDATANRTLEGLRVIEDTVRFGFNDRHLSERLKQARHQISQALENPIFSSRIRGRDTLGDVGTDLRTEQEAQRRGLRDVLHANFQRAQQGLRTLAECAKTLDTDTAEYFEKCRYELYTLHRSAITAYESLQRFARVRLYVLIDGASDPEAFARNVQILLNAKVDVIQFRDKQLDDRQRLQRATILQDLARSPRPDSHRAITIVNDRADIARAADADGVHLGQTELSVAAARTILGPDRLIGVSTHSIDQARQAVLDGADYLGVGPTFPSSTKSFTSFPGVRLVTSIAEEIALPAFAIGGIHAGNVHQITEAGMHRIAVSSAVRDADTGQILPHNILQLQQRLGSPDQAPHPPARFDPLESDRVRR